MEEQTQQEREYQIQNMYGYQTIRPENLVTSFQLTSENTPHETRYVDIVRPKSANAKRLVKDLFASLVRIWRA